MKAKAHSQSLPGKGPQKALHAGQWRRPFRSGGKPRNEPSEAASKAAGFLGRLRPVAFFLAPVFYVLGLVLCAKTVSILMLQPEPPPVAVYRSHEVFDKLLPEILSDNSSALRLQSIWTSRRKLKQQMRCLDAKSNYSDSTAPSGYLIVDASGGLNQQRSSVCNAVAMAGLLNAILLIPRLSIHNIWMDPSEFRDIYDEDHFVNTLEGHVKVVRELPKSIMERFDYNISNIPNMKVKAWTPAGYYLDKASRLLDEHGVIRIIPFTNRLAIDVPLDIQRLRCLANYKALKFSTPIATMAKKLVDRMVQKCLEFGGKYSSVHLRFEEDMVAFSCCEYDGGKLEKIELDSARQRGWKQELKLRDRCLRPDHNRMLGKCPLTPLEVGLILRGMGFSNDTPIYVASGKIYKAERNMKPLIELFPLLQTKESLLTSEELAPFQNYSSRLAALDYTVCLHSELFLTTQGGNFPNFMMGHRRFLYGGHAKTMKPDKKKLAVMLQDSKISWKAFKEQMEQMLLESNREGVTLRNSKQSVYTYPSPDCVCHKSPMNLTFSNTSRHH